MRSYRSERTSAAAVVVVVIVVDDDALAPVGVACNILGFTFRVTFRVLQLGFRVRVACKRTNPEAHSGLSPAHGV